MKLHVLTYNGHHQASTTIKKSLYRLLLIVVIQLFYWQGC